MVGRLVGAMLAPEPAGSEVFHDLSLSEALPQTSGVRFANHRHPSSPLRSAGVRHLAARNTSAATSITSYHQIANEPSLQGCQPRCEQNIPYGSANTSRPQVVWASKGECK